MSHAMLTTRGLSDLSTGRAANPWSGGGRQRVAMSEDDIRPVSAPLEVDIEYLMDTRRAARTWATLAIEPLRNLTPNWDSYGSLPLDPFVADLGIQLLVDLAMAEVPAPQTFPTPDGGLSLEWHRPELDFVISLAPPGEEPPSAFFRARDEEWEIADLTESDGRFNAAIAALKASRPDPFTD